MGLFLTVGAAQMGPISRHESRASTVKRLMELMKEAKSFNCDIVAFPELALTTFFPRWPIEDEVELDSFYETEMPGPTTRPLFDLASQLGIGFSLGYAELDIRNGVKRRFNSSVLVDKIGRIAGRYRKIHLPGHADVLDRPGQHLEKRFFEVGDKVQVTLRFRGRELAHPELGMKLLHQVRADFEPVAKVEYEPRMEGKQMIMILAPR